jgi:hypothetical protein
MRSSFETVGVVEHLKPHNYGEQLLQFRSNRRSGYPTCRVEDWLLAEGELDIRLAIGGYRFIVPDVNEFFLVEAYKRPFTRGEASFGRFVASRQLLFSEQDRRVRNGSELAQKFEGVFSEHSSH